MDIATLDDIQPSHHAECGSLIGQNSVTLQPNLAALAFHPDVPLLEHLQPLPLTFSGLSCWY